MSWSRGSRQAFAFAALAVLVVFAVSASGAAARALTSAGSGFGPVPPSGLDQSRCQGLHVASHVVFPGKLVVATTSAGICGSAPKDISWTWSVGAGPGGHGCTKDSNRCEFTAGAATTGYGEVCILGDSALGPWDSCDYFGVLGKKGGAIEGYVTDKDGGPVAGATITAYGHPGASTTSGADGYYEMQVQAGSYSVVPSGGSVKGARYLPASNSTTVTNGSIGTANFKLQTGIELQLKFAKAAVPADGLQVVDGTITTTEGGKPAPNVPVRLEVMPGDSALDSVLKAPRASVCGGGTRIWPTGTVADPDGYPVSVTTDATGHYQLAITVGTTPGVWRLDAWAKNANGTLSTDPAAASETKSITFEPLKGTPAQLPAFVGLFNFDAQKVPTTGLNNISASANTMTNTLAQATAADPAGSKLSGLAYSLVNGKDGQSVLVFQATRPPAVDRQGEIEPPLKANRGDLVMDPAEWSGIALTANGAVVTSLQSVLDQGALPDAPTIAQFAAGAPGVGWKGLPGNVVTIFQSNFEYLGWGYPGIAQPGACY